MHVVSLPVNLHQLSALVPSKLFSLLPIQPLLATTEVANTSLVLAGVLLSLVVIYIASKIGGEWCTQLGLPSVLGELVAGVVIGVSILGILVFPGAAEDGSGSGIISLLKLIANLNPEAVSSIFEAQSEVISVMAELGVILLLFEIGLESDLKQLLQVGSQAAIVAVVGVITPFTLGVVGLILLFHTPVVPAIFAGAALTATSIGITARVLEELQQLTSTEGQIIVGAAVLDDVLGIIVLAVVASLAREGTVEISKVAYLIVSAAVFLLGSIWLGRLLIPVFETVVNSLKTRGQIIIPALIFTFTLACIADLIQLEAILGAFAAGLILGESQRHQELEEQMIPIADMFVPIFFVVVGARTDISVLNPFVIENREGLVVASFLLVVSILGKLVAGLAVFGKPGINRLAIGIGMIPRGEVGLVFAAVGSASGVLSKSLNAAIVVMVIFTTFLAPPFLRLAFTNSSGRAEMAEMAEKSEE